MGRIVLMLATIAAAARRGRACRIGCKAVLAGARRRLGRRRHQQPLPDQLLPAGPPEHARRRAPLLERERRDQPRPGGPGREREASPAASSLQAASLPRRPSCRRATGPAHRSSSRRRSQCSSRSPPPVAISREGNGEAPHASAARTADAHSQVRHRGRRCTRGRRSRHTDSRCRPRREVRHPRRRLARQRPGNAFVPPRQSSTGSASTSSASRCAGMSSPAASRATPRDPRDRSISVGAGRRGAHGPEQARRPGGRHARRHARLGERRPGPEPAAAGRHGVRRLRVRRGEPVPVRPSLDDLERAEPGALAEPRLAEGLRRPAAQPRLRRDQGREPVRARRRAA